MDTLARQRSAFCTLHMQGGECVHLRDNTRRQHLWCELVVRGSTTWAPFFPKYRSQYFSHPPHPEKQLVFALCSHRQEPPCTRDTAMHALGSITWAPSYPDKPRTQNSSHALKYSSFRLRVHHMGPLLPIKTQIPKQQLASYVQEPPCPIIQRFPAWGPSHGSPPPPNTPILGVLALFPWQGGAIP